MTSLFGQTLDVRADDASRRKVAREGAKDFMSKDVDASDSSRFLPKQWNNRSRTRGAHPSIRVEWRDELYESHFIVAHGTVEH